MHYNLAHMTGAVLRSSRFILILAVVWVIMQESFALSTILTGTGIGVVTLYVTNVLVLKERYRELYQVRLIPVIWYGIKLLSAIYVAGLQAVVKMITRRINVGVVDIDTDLTDEFAVALLANSITLTPGTVTLDRRGSRLKVIWLDCVTREPEAAGEAIKGGFEGMIRRITE